MKKEKSSFYISNEKINTSSSDETDAEEGKKYAQSNLQQLHKRKLVDESPSSSEDENKEIVRMNLLNLQAKGKKTNRPLIKKEIEGDSSSFESDAEDKIEIVRSNPFYVEKSLEENSSESEDENKVVGKLNLASSHTPSKIYEKTLKSIMKQDKNMSKLRRNSLINEKKIMEHIDRTPFIKSEVKTSSDSDSGASTKSKVKVLQDVHLNPVLKSPKERLEKEYPGLKEHKTDVDINFSESDDIYLFRIPKNVDPNLLKNVTFDLEEEFRLKINEKYNVTWTTKIPDPTLVVSDNCRVINFKRNIKMEKYIKSKKEPEIVIPEKKTMPLPNNLKNRHPLFGLDFEQKIILNENVERRLDDAIANILRKEKKMKLKKHKKRKPEPDDEKQKEEIFHLLNSHSSKTKIKKETSEDSAFSSSGSFEKISKRNKKKQNIINDTYKKEKYESDLDSYIIKSPKKKKKELKMGHSWEETRLESIKKENEIEGEEVSPNLSKREKKRLSMINSTLMTDVLKAPHFNPDVSRITSDTSILGEKSTKSKRKKESDDKMISSILDDLKDDIQLPKRVKKKKKHKEIDN